MRSTRSADRRTLLGCLCSVATGMALVAAYHLLVAYDIGKIGDPTDIGGGGLLLLGYLLILVGAVGAGVLLVHALRDRGGGSR